MIKQKILALKYWKRLMEPNNNMVIRNAYDSLYELIKLTRGVCRGLQCYAGSPEKLFSFLEGKKEFI